MAQNIQTESFDFGFTAVDEDELDLAKSIEAAEKSLDESNDKLMQLYEAIRPLLNNLKKNPEKEFIKWPNRIEKIEQFENHIAKIVGI